MKNKNCPNLHFFITQQRKIVMKPLMRRVALSLLLAICSIQVSYALPANGTSVKPWQISLQGGSNSGVQWRAPLASTYKVWVNIPTTSTATNAVYRLYLQGNIAGNTICSSTDASYPCFEISVNAAENQGKWVLLSVKSGSKITNQWQFSKEGFVSINASNLSTAQQLDIAAVSFENMNPALAIGKTYKGGIIFYLDNTKSHGLIAAPQDQDVGVHWYNGSYLVTNATDTAVGSGKANTTTIVNTQGAGSYAAKLCDDLVAGGYSDWYLPSKDELNLMYANIGQGAAAPLTNLGGFAAGSYWSSSEMASNGAWSQNFIAGSQLGYYKNAAFYVRAIRAF
jgi:hypothetical protein